MLKGNSNFKSIELSTVIGIIAAIASIIVGISINGQIASFVDIPSVLIVLFGTFTTTTACFSLSDVLKSHMYIAKAVIYAIEDPKDAAINGLRISIFARTYGIAALEIEARKQNYSNFLLRAIERLSDRDNISDIEKLLTQEIVTEAEQHAKVISILRKSAEIAPAMGLIGTLIGLVQMLSSMNDVAKIGPAMALAILTTFYGAFTAYVIFFPLAAKLEKNSKEKILISRIYLKSILSISKNENPRILEKELNSILSESNNINFFRQ